MERIEVLTSAGNWACVVTFMPVPSLAPGYWHETWSNRAAAKIIDEAHAGNKLSEYIKAEGDGLYGHGGRVHVRLDGEPEYPHIG